MVGYALCRATLNGNQPLADQGLFIAVEVTINPALLLLLLTVNPPDTLHYRISLDYSQETLGSQLAARLEGSLTLIERLDSNSVRQVAIRLDTLYLVTSPGQPVPPVFQADPALVTGLSWSADLREGKTADGFRISQENPLANLFTASLELLYPGFPDSLRAGAQWTDSSSSSTAAPTAQERSTVVAWHLTSRFDSAVVVSGETRGLMTMTRSTALGQRSDRISMSGTRNLSGPLQGPMHSVVATSEQTQLTFLPGSSEPVEVRVKSRLTLETRR